MIILFLLISILVVMYVYFALYKYPEIGLPSVFGGRWPRWPAIRNAIDLAIFGDSIKLYQIAKYYNKASLKCGGYKYMSMGPLNGHLLSDPDDCILLSNTCVDKHYIFYKFTKRWLGNGLLSAPAPIWLKRRKQLQPMFSHQMINGFMYVFNKQARKLVHNFADKVGTGDFDHEPLLMAFGLESICQTAFGINIGDFLTNNDVYVKTISRLLETVVMRFAKVWLHSDFLFQMSSLKKKQDAYLKTFNQLSDMVIQKYKTKLKENIKAKNHDDNLSSREFNPFIDFLLKAAIEYNFTDEEMREEINTLILAGYETSATTIVFALMLLGHYPDVQEKVYKELEEVFGESDRDVDKQDLQNLVYLDAFVKETLRYSPLALAVIRTTTTELKLKKITLPANSHILIGIYALLRHPMWGPDVNEFKPERWLNPDTLPKHPGLVAYFALGKRFCIGKTYAMVNIKTTLAHLLRRYKITSDFSKLVMKFNFLVKPAYGQHISLKERK